MSFSLVSLTLAFLLIFDAATWGTKVQKAMTREETLEALKGRYNYASSDCAARVLSSNKGCKSSSAILQSQKDTYLRNLCSFSQKHVILELCQDIRIDTIVLANFEYFSSMVREFRVAVSKRYPVGGDDSGGWREVGRFVAENSRREQVFPVGGTGYARYVRVDFDTHYGNEYYCLLSVFRVYGKTMMEDFEESSSPSGKPAGQPRAEPATSGHPLSTAGRAMAVMTLGPLPGTGTGRSTTIVDAPATTQRVNASLMGANKGELAVAVTDLLALFRQQATNCCRATSPISPPRPHPPHPPDDTTTMDGVSDDGESPVLPQENVFKAIHDRLQLLERNVTRSTRSLEGEIAQLMEELKTVKEEVGVTTKDAAPKSSFRARLLQHLERKNQEFSTKILDEIDAALVRAEGTERMVFWLAVLTFLQITGLISVVSMGFALGWFKPSDERLSRIPSLCPHHPHRRSTSAGVILTPAAPAPIAAVPTASIDEAEQLVPQSEGPGEVYRGTSPTRSDLIVTASRPLLLDESEAELIDAVYVSSPCSSRSSLGGGGGGGGGGGSGPASDPASQGVSRVDSPSAPLFLSEGSTPPTRGNKS